MAKRAVDQRPFRPLDESLIRAVVATKHEAPRDTEIEVTLSPSVAELPREAPNTEPVTSAPDIAKPVITARREVQQNKAFSVEKLEFEKRLLLTQSESRAMDRLVSALASELGTPVKLSHVLRACTALLLHSESALTHRAHESERLMRPPNGDVQALIRFEKSLAGLISAAIKDAGPMR